MDVTTLLVNSQSHDPNIRHPAEAALQQAQAQNFPGFLSALTGEVASVNKPPEVRHLAGIMLKNTLTAKSEERQAELTNQWITTVPQELKEMIKGTMRDGLGDGIKPVRGITAQIVARIASIELPRGQWNDLIDNLLANVATAGRPDGVREGTLQCLGYICEELANLPDPAEGEAPPIEQSQTNKILTAVVQGMRKEETNNDIRLAATTALFNALEFVHANFESEPERNFIMQVVYEAATCTEMRVRVLAYQCLARIATLYYEKLAQYMQALFGLTLEAIKTDEEDVALQAIEFWSTLCDEEQDVVQEAIEAREEGRPPERVCMNFVRGAVRFIVPILMTCLTRQDEDATEGDWDVSMAAGTCLSLMALTVEDDIVEHVLPFVQQHINNPDWRYREAATLAFGSILEGPRDELVQPLVDQAMNVLLHAMKDASANALVKDTTAWTLGRICDLHPGTIGENIGMLVQVLVEALGEPPRVAGNVCWALHNLAEANEADDDQETYVLSPYFSSILENLVKTADRGDASESNLRNAAYESLNTLIQSSSTDMRMVVVASIPVFIDRLEQTGNMGLSKEERDELQGLLCGVLQGIAQKLASGKAGENLLPYADRMMQLFIQVMQIRSATIHEEALLAVGSLASAIGLHFRNYMEHFMPLLYQGLENHEEHQVCSVAVGVVGDLCRALEREITPYCGNIIRALLLVLQDPGVNRDVKPIVLSTFGDVALAIGGQFEVYLAVVMGMLYQASMTQVDENDYDLVDYLNKLREGILDSFTGIIQGLKGDNKADLLMQFVDMIVNFLYKVQQDSHRYDPVTRAACGVVGDLVHALGPSVAGHINQHFVTLLLKDGSKSVNYATKEVSKWAREVISGRIR